MIIQTGRLLSRQAVVGAASAALANDSGETQDENRSVVHWQIRQCSGATATPRAIHKHVPYRQNESR